MCAVCCVITGSEAEAFWKLSLAGHWWGEALPYYKPKYSIRLNNNNVNHSNAALDAQVVVASFCGGKHAVVPFIQPGVLNRVWLPFCRSMLEIRAQIYFPHVFENLSDLQGLYR